MMRTTESQDDILTVSLSLSLYIYIRYIYVFLSFLFLAQSVKNLPAMQETWI